MDLETALQKAVTRPTQKPRKPPKPSKKPTPTKITKTPERGRGGHFKATTPWSKRLTLDITPEQNKFLASFSVEHETKKNPVLRELINLLEADPKLAQQVLERLNK